MATTLLNADELPCHICYLSPSTHAFKCCFRDEQMKICRDCIESIAMHKLMKEVVDDLPIDLNGNFNLPCPFCRQNYVMIYDKTSWGEYLIEDFINLQQSVALIKFTKNHFMEEMERMRANLRSHHEAQLSQQRRRMTEEVLLPLSRLLNIEHRRVTRNTTPRR